MCKYHEPIRLSPMGRAVATATGVNTGFSCSYPGTVFQQFVYFHKIFNDLAISLRKPLSTFVKQAVFFTSPVSIPIL